MYSTAAASEMVAGVGHLADAGGKLLIAELRNLTT
jgi:hypothetical protein